MANIKEWIKGIGIFIFTSIMFYFFWDNIFLNLINWAGTDFICAGEVACTSGLATSFTILKTTAWVSFIAIYLAVSPLYLIFCIMNGARNDIESNPIELLKGLGIWAVSMPFLVIILGIIYRLIESLESATSSFIDVTIAGNFAWVITLLVMIGVTIFPFIFIVKGYGIKSIEKVLEGEEGG